MVLTREQQKRCSCIWTLLEVIFASTDDARIVWVAPRGNALLNRESMLDENILETLDAAGREFVEHRPLTVAVAAEEQLRRST